ncbi:hypothetical protein C8R42DRAFT_724224 [Lentinula raphanica]|nr:hypothetical protein C8R42DRAFT_724224 [Lentinula raphanica]
MQEVQLTSAANKNNPHSGGSSTLKTIIQSFNSKHLQVRGSRKKIQVTFNIAELLLETGISSSQSEIKVDVPIPIMTTIVQQCRISAFGTILPPLESDKAADNQEEGSRPTKWRKVNCDNIQDISSEDSDSNESFHISEVILAQNKQEYIEILSSDDDRK